MDLRPRGIAAFARSDAGRKWIRYSMVSVVGMTVSQICIIVLTRGFGVPDLLTNFLAVSISSIPAYLLNRAWVWGKHGKNHLTKEVLPFWGFSLAGLVFSSLLVAWIGPGLESGETATAMDTFRVMVGNIGGFAILWIAKFFVLDKLLFATHHPDDVHDVDTAGELGPDVAPSESGVEGTPSTRG